MHLRRDTSDHVFSACSVDNVTVAVLPCFVCPAQPVGIELGSLFRIGGVQIRPAQRADAAKGSHAAMSSGLEDADECTRWILYHGKSPDIRNIRRSHNLLGSELD